MFTSSPLETTTFYQLLGCGLGFGVALMAFVALLGDGRGYER